MWDALKSKIEALKNSQVDVEKFKGADYSNKTDADFLQAKSTMAEINSLFDAVKLFRQHVVPCLGDTSVGDDMSLQSLSDSLLERVNTIAQSWPSSILVTSTPLRVSL